jgi:hypothetical protein
VSKSARKVVYLAAVGLFAGACGSSAGGGGADASAGATGCGRSGACRGGAGGSGTGASGIGGSIGSGTGGGGGTSAGGTGGTGGGGGTSAGGAGGSGGGGGTSAGGTGGGGGGAGASSCGSQLPGDPSSAEVSLGQIEADLVAAGRADANFAAVFGADADSVLAAADALRAQAVDVVLASEMLGSPAGPPTVLPDPATCGITLAALTLPQTWKSSTFLATGNLLLALDGTQIDTDYAPLDGDVPSGNGKSHIHQTMHVTLSLTASHAISVATITTTITQTDASGGALGSTSENATATIDVDFCPTDAGQAIGTITYSGNGTTSPVGSPPGTYQIGGSGSYTIHVNEAAETSSVDLTGALTKTGMGPTTVDVAGTFMGAYDPANAAATLVGKYAFQRNVAPAAEFNALTEAVWGVPFLASLVAEDGAKKKWRGGACVAVRVDPGSEMVDPGAQMTVTGTPFQRFLATNIDAPVVATFAGDQSLTPVNQPVPAPAPFSFVAGSVFKQQGVVSLKSTSRRGIGTGNATYTVRCAMTCPTGFTLNTDTCQCECQKTCGTNQVLDPASCQCVCAQTSCPAGRTFDPASCQCVCAPCPLGQVQDPQSCACSCEIMPLMGGNLNPNCTWSGTVAVTSNVAGDMDVMMEMADVRTTWSFSYAAPLAVNGAGAGFNTLGGTVNSAWHKVVVTTGSPCSNTETTDDSLSAIVDQVQMNITSAGPGALMLALNMVGARDVAGTTTDVPSGADCGMTLSSPDELVFDGFTASGPASGNRFMGSTNDPNTVLSLPDNTLGRFLITWDLTLVPK